jgi:RHS repeat-associated protein
MKRINIIFIKLRFLYASNKQQKAPCWRKRVRVASASVPALASAYKFRFGKKEFQDELGLNFYDFGFRNYMPDIGRWGCVDNMSEKYLSASPYHYAGNNPVLFYDVDGNEFTKAAWEWVKQLVADINSRQESNNKDIANYTANNSELEATRGETATLAASDQVYDVENDSNGTEKDALGNSSTTNQTYYNTSNDRVTITVSSGTNLGLFSHELKHAFQFETGQTSLSFNKKPVVNFLHDAWDEVAAYERGQLFGQRENINSPEDLVSKGLYSGLQMGPNSIYNHKYDLTNPSVQNQLNEIALRKQQAFRINSTTYNGKR